MCVTIITLVQIVARLPLVTVKLTNMKGIFVTQSGFDSMVWNIFFYRDTRNFNTIMLCCQAAINFRTVIVAISQLGRRYLSAHIFNALQSVLSIVIK